MKRNGGILFTRYREGIKSIFLFFIFIISCSAYGQKYPILYYQEKDSCLCMTYQKLHEEQEMLMPLENGLKGLEMSLSDIVKNVQKALLENEFKDSVMDNHLIMQIVIDEKGNMRCANIYRGREEVSQKAFNLLSQYKYEPATNRGKPGVDTFFFILK